VADGVLVHGEQNLLAELALEGKLLDKEDTLKLVRWKALLEVGEGCSRCIDAGHIECYTLDVGLMCTAT